MNDIKAKIKTQSSKLFCEQGVKNVTLRDVAKLLDKSYGNITYHYKGKGDLLIALLDDFTDELSIIQKELKQIKDPFVLYKNWSSYFLETYTKYRYFIIDFLEIKRAYADLLPYKLEELFLHGKKRRLLIELQQKGYLLKNLNQDRFEHILELERALGLFLLQNEKLDTLTFQKKMNWLIYPYLTDKGKLKYIRS